MEDTHVERSGRSNGGASVAQVAARVTPEWHQALRRDGYAVVPGILDDVAGARARCDELLASHTEAEVPASAILADDVLGRIPVGPAMMAVYRQLFPGPAALFPNLSLRRNVYTPWHVDRGFVGKGDYVRDEGFRAYQFGIYFSDDPRSGLDVRPRSQRILLRAPFRNRALLDVYSYAASLRYRPRSVREAAPGDLIIWDCRIFHRGTPKTKGAGEKIAYYWSASMSHADHERTFMAHLVGRAKGKGLTAKASSHANLDRYDELASLDILEALHPSVRTEAEDLVAAGRLRLIGANRV